jgi:hypothetical protein
MTVAELIDWLGQYDGELPVRIASQPQWPFENDIAHVDEYDGTSHLELHLDDETGKWVVDDHAAEERLFDDGDSREEAEEFLAGYRAHKPRDPGGLPLRGPPDRLPAGRGEGRLRALKPPVRGIA